MAIQEQGPTNRKRLTPEEIQAAVDELRSRTKEEPPQLDAIDDIERYFSSPAMQGAFAASTPFGGWVPRVATALGTAAAATSTYNRYRQGDYPGMIIPGVETLVGAAALKTGHGGATRSRNIDELAKAANLSAEEVAILRAEQNVDPKLWSPGMRRIMAAFTGRAMPSTATVKASAASVRERMETILKEKAAAEAAASGEGIDPETGMRSKPQARQAGQKAPKNAAGEARVPFSERPPVITRSGRQAPVEAPVEEVDVDVPPATFKPGQRRPPAKPKPKSTAVTPTKAAPEPTEPGWITNGRKVVNRSTGEVGYQQADGSIVDADGVEIVAKPTAPEAAKFPPGQPRPAAPTAKPAPTSEAAKPAPAPTAAPSKPAGVPMMITRQMRADLKALGHTDEAIDKMKPADAHAILGAPKPTSSVTVTLGGKPKPKPAVTPTETPAPPRTLKPGQPRPAVTGGKPKTRLTAFEKAMRARAAAGDVAHDFAGEADLPDFPAQPPPLRRRPEVETAIPGVTPTGTGTGSRIADLRADLARYEKLLVESTGDENPGFLKSIRARIADIQGELGISPVGKPAQAFTPGSRRPPTKAKPKAQGSLFDEPAAPEAPVKAAKPAKPVKPTVVPTRGFKPGEPRPAVTPGKGGVAVEEPPTTVFPAETREVAALMVQRNALGKARRALDADLKAAGDAGTRSAIEGAIENNRQQIFSLGERIKKLKAGKPPSGGEPPAAKAVTTGGTDGPQTPSPVTVTPEADVAAPDVDTRSIRQQVHDSLVSQRNAVLVGLEINKDFPPMVRELREKLARIDEELLRQSDPLTWGPNQNVPRPPSASVIPPRPVARGTVARAREGATPPPVVEPPQQPRVPVGPSLGLDVEAANSPQPKPKVGELAPEPVEAPPPPADVTPTAPPKPQAEGTLHKSVQAYLTLKSKQGLLKRGIRPYGAGGVDLKTELRVVNERLERLEKTAEVQAYNAQQAAAGVVAEAPIEVPIKKRRRTRPSTSPEEAARIEAEMAAERAAEKARRAEGDKPWTGVRNPPPAPQPSRKALEAERVAREAAERQEVLKKALARVKKQGQTPKNPLAARLKATGTIIKRQLKKLAPEVVDVGDDFEAKITAAADDIEKRLPQKQGPRLVDPKTGKVIKQLGAKEHDDAGFFLNEMDSLMVHMAGAAGGAVAGGIYGNRQVDDEGGTHGFSGAAAGALLGLLGAKGVGVKGRGGSLLAAARKYHFFSLLSDPTVWLRANMGSMGTTLSAIGEQAVLKKFRNAGDGIRQYTRDASEGKWVDILLAPDQTAHLPAQLRKIHLSGRAPIATSYNVLDWPSRFIAAGDIMAVRALHKMGYGLEEIQRMNLGGTPETMLGKQNLAWMGEGSFYNETNAKGVTSRKYMKPHGGERYQALMRAGIPFARMAVGLPERTIAYAPIINEIPFVRKAYSGISKTRARARGAIGLAGLGAGYALSRQTTNETDPWITAAAGPVGGLAQIGVGARRALESDQGMKEFAMQQLQNLAPGLSEQLDIPGITARWIPGASKFVAKTMDPAYGRSTSSDDLSEARSRAGLAEGHAGMIDSFIAKMKERIPGMRETLPQKYRGRMKLGEDLYPERNPWAPRIVRDTTMRGNIFGYDMVAPKWAAGAPQASAPRFAIGDPISQRLRELENQTGQPIIGIPNQPLNDPLYEMLAQESGVPAHLLHRDIKAAIERVRGMAPRRLLAEIITRDFKSRPLAEQVRRAQAIVTDTREAVNKTIQDIPRGSLILPRERDKFVRMLNELARTEAGGWK